MSEQLVAVALVSAIGIAFALGVKIGWHAGSSGAQYRIDRLRDENSRLRAEAVTGLYRPQDDVEPVPPEVERRVLADFFSAYDPRYHSTETE